MALTSFEGTWEEIQLHGQELAGRYVRVMVLDASEETASASTNKDIQKVSDSLSERIMEIGKQCAALPDLDPRTADEILGYNDYGLPE